MMLNNAENPDYFIDKNGHVFILLSMSKLDGGNPNIGLNVRQHTPEDSLDFVEEISAALPESNLTFSFLYTAGLYENTADKGYKTHSKTTKQMTRHRQKLSRLLKEKSIQAEVVAWNQLILNSNGNWESEFAKIMKRYKNDPLFAEAVHKDRKKAKGDNIAEQEHANNIFILEELLVMEKLRRREILTPLTQDQPDFSAIAYAGKPFESDLYLINGQRAIRAKPKTLDPARAYTSYQFDISNPEQVDFYKTMAVLPTVKTLKSKIRRMPLYQRVACWAALLATVILNKGDITAVQSSENPLARVDFNALSNTAVIEKDDRKTSLAFAENGALTSAILHFNNGQQVVYTDINAHDGFVVDPYGKIKNFDAMNSRADGYLFFAWSNNIQEDVDVVKKHRQNFKL